MTKNILPHRNIVYSTQAVHRLPLVTRIEHRLSEVSGLAMFCQRRTAIVFLCKPKALSMKEPMYLCGLKKMSCSETKYKKK